MKHEEDRLQVQVADYLRLQYPKVLWFHVPNGGNRNAREGARFKRMGVLPGVADILIFHPGRMNNFDIGKYNGLCVELKIKPNKQADSQKEFQNKISQVGWRYELCYTFDESKRIIDNYLSN
jgi:hypothetical protein